MNVHMYDHPAVKRNISVLYQDGFRFIEPSEGYLACGYVGKGRLEEPENIVKLAEKHFADEKSLLWRANVWSLQLVRQGKRLILSDFSPINQRAKWDMH